MKVNRKFDIKKTIKIDKLNPDAFSLEVENDTFYLTWKDNEETLILNYFTDAAIRFNTEWESYFKTHF